MQAKDFITKWGPGGPAHDLNERAGAQAHFIDLCRLLDVEEPGDAERYCFERGLIKTGSTRTQTDGWADVWLKGHFAWEYKAPGKNLEVALKQLMAYVMPLENPPLLVVSDRLHIEVHTHFTGTPSEKHVFLLDELAQHDVRQRLRTLWVGPDVFKPRRTNRDITEEAARTFAGMAERMRAALASNGNETDSAPVVSHFLTQCLFCFFAEDVGLLPERLFERMVGAQITPERLRTQLQALLKTMGEGGLFGVDDIAWFNGGLFKSVAVPPLTTDDVAALRAASALNWSAIDPSIFGTLFERGLDPAKRSQLGAHYTDPSTIARLIEPVIQRPLLIEWTEHKAQIGAHLARRDTLRDEAAATPSTSKALKDKFARLRTQANAAEREAQEQFIGYLTRLRDFRVLDPACGSGNFLYLALKAIKDIEHQANLEAEALGLARQQDMTGPHNVLGIELNEYAAELARVTVWIGELQWRIQRGYGFKLNPVLEPLDHIECRDALVNADGSEADWPAADAVVGNPPFVGDKKMRAELGDTYTEQLRTTFKGRVPGGADLVCYWFEKARSQIEARALKRAGLVSTQSIRAGSNREVLSRLIETAPIFEAWSDEPWVNNGAAVRVSLIAFGHAGGAPKLDGAAVERIYADLTAGEGLNLSQAVPLTANAGAAFQGPSKVGPFEIAATQAHEWLALPNIHGRSNSEVLRPWFNGGDITDRWKGHWIIDFGASMTEADAALFDAPFAHVTTLVRPEREKNNRAAYRRFWYRFAEARAGLRRAIEGQSRFIVTPRVAKHRVFAWLDGSACTDTRLYVLARSDDTSMGLLHSRVHEVWSLAQASMHGVGNDPTYNAKSCFETFPFPAGLTPADTAHQRVVSLEQNGAGGGVIPDGLESEVRNFAEAIARAAHRLNTLREAWLNPPEWSERVPEVVPLGMTHSPYPDRIVARAGFEKELAKRTLTNLYNARPTWLAQAHAALDAAVATAYGWSDYSPAMADDEILRRLLALNLARA